MFEKRLAEIRARKLEIRRLLESGEQVNLEELEQELRTLEAEEQEIERRRELAQKIQIGDPSVNLRAVATFDAKDPDPEPEELRARPEYRVAFLKALQGKPLTEAEKRWTSVEAAPVIPLETERKIFDRMTKIAPMLNEITLLRVAGNVRIAVQGNRAPAGPHQENQPIAPANDTLIQVTLGGFEFVKAVSVSATVRTMAIDAFEDWLTKILAEDLAVAIDNEIINGGTVTGCIAQAQNWQAGANYVQYAGQISYDDICDCIALLPAQFDRNAKWLMNKATFYQQIMKITDANGNLIAIQSLADGGAWRIMGYPVLIDDNVGPGVVFFGDYTQVVGNLSQDVRVEASAHSGFMRNAIDYRGTAIFDCAVAQGVAITKIDQ